MTDIIELTTIMQVLHDVAKKYGYKISTEYRNIEIGLEVRFAKI